jgi:hypothetical protein
MAIVIQLVSSDESLLGSVAEAVTSSDVSISDPALVEDAAALNLDLSSVDVRAVWDAMVAVGQLAGAMQVVRSIVDLLARRRRHASVTTTVEVVVNGATVTFSGDLSPEEATRRIERFRELATAALDGT